MKTMALKKLIRTYNKTELALLYNPYVQPSSARRLLRRWIDNNEKVKQELAQTGYTRYTRVFTPRQVEIIFDNLGIP